MASKTSACLALLFALNLLFFTLTDATDYDGSPSPKPRSAPSLKVPIRRSAQSFYPPGSSGICPLNVLDLGVCKTFLGLVPALHAPACCHLIDGLVGFEPVVCICAAIKDGVLGINLDASKTIDAILNGCGKTFPSGIKCPA